MKICMFTNTFLPHVGGVARSVAFFTEDLIRKGHQVLVVAPEYGEEEDCPLCRDNEIRVPAIQNINKGGFSLRIPLPLFISEALDRFRPELIHSHHPYMLGDSALRESRRLGVPLVFTHHTLYEEYTHYTPFDSDGFRKFMIHLSTEYANLCDRVIAPSKSLADLISERGVTTPIEEIPTGVDTEFFEKGDGPRFRKNHGIAENAAVIGHLGRLAPEKNLEYLSKAVAKSIGSFPDAVFLVAGAGPSQDDIRRIFSDAKLQDRLFMAGAVKGDDLRDAYHAMDLFVFASKSETQGMVLTEAMAAGLPVIALDASGVREVVRDGVNGRLLACDALAEQFSESIVKNFLEGGPPENWREAALAAAKKFSRENIVRKLATLYESVVESYSEPDEISSEWLEIIGAETIPKRLKAEWDLISEKTAAAVKALGVQERKPRQPAS